MTEWIKKQDPSICCQKRLISDPKTPAAVRGWKNISHANMCQKKARIAIFILDKIELKQNCNKRQRILYNNKGDHPTNYTYNCKYLCPQHETTQIHKAVNNKNKGTNQ